MRRRGVVASVAAALAVALPAAGCSATASASAAGATKVDVELRDFAIRLSRATVPAGRVEFDIHNTGPSTHEFNLVRTNLSDTALPLTREGLAVDDSSPALDGVADFGEVGLGHRARHTLELRPGHYVVYCNLEGHYLGGTRAQIDVVDAARPAGTAKGSR